MEAFDPKNTKELLIESYLSIVVIICIASCVIDIFLAKNLITVLILGTTILSLTVIKILKLYNKERVSYICFIALSSLIFYFALNRQLPFLNLYYVNVILAIFFVYEWKNNFRKIISLLIIISVEVVLNLFTNFLKSGISFTPVQYYYIFTISLFFFVLLLFVNIRFTIRNKQNLEWYIDQYNLNIQQKEKFFDEVSLEKLASFKEQLFENYHGFLNHVQQLYPHFYSRVKQLENITVSDIEILALIRLHLSTNEIAQITNLTIKAIESKKYRLRKKFKIPTSDDLYIWTDNI
jgi:DNA-binding CsgD family transcriptional regulator